MSPGHNPSVIVVQRRLTHYRAPLFEALRTALAERSIRLELLVGHGTAEEEGKRDSGVLSWAQPIETHYLAGGRLCWQPLYRHLKTASLVVITQENKLIQNHLLLLRPNRFKLAFWGHGANLQSRNPQGFKERFKRWTTNRVDWWFAYTQMSARLVEAAGFPPERITVLNNAVDTTLLQQQKASVSATETRALRHALGFGEGPVGVFVGSLYADKRLDFLLAAASTIRQQVPDFHLLIVGEGPEREKVRAWCGANSWARWVGAQVGRDKAAYVSMASVMLNPGLVGLGILDAFVFGVPMVTTDCGIHSPEIAYLQHGINGVMTADDLHSYANTCAGLLADQRRLSLLRNGCHNSAKEYTVQNMALRFADGIANALAS